MELTPESADSSLDSHSIMIVLSGNVRLIIPSFAFIHSTPDSVGNQKSFIDAIISMTGR